jgi:hypothetical protein
MEHNPSWKVNSQSASQEIPTFYGTQRSTNVLTSFGDGWEANNYSTEKKDQDSDGSGQWPVVGSCEHGNEPSDSIKGKEFPD